MSDETYEGWANRETWAVALHINNDQGWQEDVLDDLRSAQAARDLDGEDALKPSEAGDLIRENVEQVLTPYDDDRAANSEVHLTEGQYLALIDFGSLWRVDWQELGAAFLSDLDES